MPYRKGKSGNPAGKRKGTQNRVTQEMKSLINDFLHAHWSKFEADYAKIEPTDRIKFFITLLDYVTPKLTKTEAKINNRIEPAINMMNLTPAESEQLYGLLEKTGWQDDPQHVTAIAYVPPEEPIP